MTFIWPLMLFTLILVPLLIIQYVSLQRRRQRMANQFASLGMGQNAGMMKQPGIRRHIPPLFFLTGLTILLVAIARPQTNVNLPKIEGTVILAFDVSGSMAADDMKPTRLEAAKAAARDFVQRQPTTVQIGVVGFSDSGYSVQSPTNDQQSILAAIERLTPQRGTSVGHGIQASLNAIAVGKGQVSHLYSNLTPQPTASPTPVPKGTYTSAVIIMLSDGDNNENPDPFGEAKTAADRGVRIYTVGIGSPAGTTLHVNGFTVHTQLDEATLQQIAQITDGEYFNAQTGQELHSIYDHLDPELILKPEKLEVTSLFAGASILALMIGGVFSLLWFSRLP
ncbi:MAG TPA: VWA domain-containing protein [Anaerolineaceae bacterium]|nr:VWA domain-containing protein [Anaerolineaceae bacterium]